MHVCRLPDLSEHTTKCWLPGCINQEVCPVQQGRLRRHLHHCVGGVLHGQTPAALAQGSSFPWWGRIQANMKWWCHITWRWNQVTRTVLPVPEPHACSPYFSFTPCIGWIHPSYDWDSLNKNALGSKQGNYEYITWFLAIHPTLMGILVDSWPSLLRLVIGK